MPKNIRWRWVFVLFFLLFLGWRMIRPLNIFVVSDQFARPMAITAPPAGLDSLSAAECGECHRQVYKEWSTSIHSQAWTDPYYQVDYVFDGSQPICLNCHIPLQNQQKNLVVGFKDKQRFKPILKKNPDFDYDLQQEGVTCVVCHLRDGVIIGPYKDANAPHPTRYDSTMTNGFGICKKCHMVAGDRWDTFFSIPPCGTVAEIRKNDSSKKINCTGCHMPEVGRASGHRQTRTGRSHMFLGGHDPDTLRRAVRGDLSLDSRHEGHQQALLTLTNIGADHFLPTGTPDRHLTVTFTLNDGAGRVIKTKTHILKRTILWRPFIIDLWDTRLVRDESRRFVFSWNNTGNKEPVSLKIVVRYHLLDESRRQRIDYQNREPISYPIYTREITVAQ